MDAGFIPTTPPPTTQASESAPDAHSDDAATFAAHLTPQEAPAKPASRKPTGKSAQGDAEDAPSAPAQPLNYALSSPTAAVVVRLDAAPALTDVAFTPAPTVIAPAIDASTLPPQAALEAPSQPSTSPSSPAPQVGPAAPGANPAAPQPAAPSQPEPSKAATSPALAVVADIPASVVPTPVRAATPVEPLRASGRQRADRLDATAADAPRAVTPAQPTVAVAAASARAGASRDAPSPMLAQTPATGEGAPQTAALSETAPATGESRRLADSAPPAVHRLPTPAATVAQHIVRRFEGQSTSIEVRLDPAELGMVQVKLEVGPDSRVTALVAADNPATLADLMRSARDLERALESAGLELASGGLSFDLSDRRSASGADDDADASAMLRGASEDAESGTTPAPASRPFGLEAWRGVRVDMTV